MTKVQFQTPKCWECGRWRMIVSRPQLNNFLVVSPVSTSYLPWWLHLIQKILCKSQKPPNFVLGFVCGLCSMKKPNYFDWWDFQIISFESSQQWKQTSNILQCNIQSNPDFKATDSTWLKRHETSAFDPFRCLFRGPRNNSGESLEMNDGGLFGSDGAPL